MAILIWVWALKVLPWALLQLCTPGYQMDNSYWMPSSEFIHHAAREH